MEGNNVYAAPKAALADAPVEYGEIKVFSATGRIGRIRYIGYSVGLTLVFGALLGIIAGFLKGGLGAGIAVTVIMAVGYLAMMVVTALLTIQRAHDFNSSGWISLLVLIPLVNLIFWFAPGTAGENRFGRQTPPNGIGTILLALIMPLVIVLGIVAAIAIPAYQAYVEKARASETDAGHQK